MKTLLTPLIAIGLLFGCIGSSASAQMDVTASEVTRISYTATPQLWSLAGDQAQPEDTPCEWYDPMACG